MVRLTDHTDKTIAVHCGRNTTTQQQQQPPLPFHTAGKHYSGKALVHAVFIVYIDVQIDYRCTDLKHMLVHKHALRVHRAGPHSPIGRAPDL